MRRLAVAILAWAIWNPRKAAAAFLSCLAAIVIVALFCVAMSENPYFPLANLAALGAIAGILVIGARS